MDRDNDGTSVNSNAIDQGVQYLLEVLQIEPGASVLPLVQVLYSTWRSQAAEAAPPPPGIELLRFDLAKALFSDLKAPPVFDHAEDPQALEDLYYAIESRMLTEDNGTHQWGLGSVLSSLRYRAAEAEAGPDGVMPGKIQFVGAGIGYREIPLVATFPNPTRDAHLGTVAIRFADSPEQLLARLPLQLVTGFRDQAPSIEALGRLHRFSRYGEGMVTFGNWFSADGHGRELLAAMVDGLVNRVMPDVPNGMGGTSPQFALTEQGLAFVLSHPKLAGLFDHYNGIEASTAWLVDGAQRVPFDTHTGAILGRLETGSSDLLAYVTKANLAGVVAGQDYRRDELGYLLARDIAHERACTVQLEDYVPDNAFIQLSEEDFDQQFGLVNGSLSDTTNYEYDEVKDMDPRYVWSLVEGEDDDGTAYALPGFHRVNNIGYTVTEKPWPHEHIEAVYMAGQEHADDMRP